MRVGYYYSSYGGFAKVGSSLKTMDLYDVLFNSPGLAKLNPKHNKHEVGSIWFHTNDKTGIEYNPVSDGLLCCDIDAISKEECKKIMDSFDKLSLAFPCLISTWYSFSYYNNEKSYGGLHIAIKSNKDKLVDDKDKRLDNKEYFSYKSTSLIYTAALARAIYNVCGIDVRPYRRDDIGKDAGIDRHLTSISHQCFLNYSHEVKWNNNIFDVIITDEVYDKIVEWFNEDYHPNKKGWFPVKSEYKIESIEVKKFDASTYNGNKLNLGHNNRVTIENFLANEGWDKKSIVEFMMQICGPDDYAGGFQALYDAVNQTTETAIAKYSNSEIEDWIVEKAANLLERIGIDIEVDIKRVYAPLDYNFDAIFEEVWESVKDKPFHNVYYNPKNVLRLQLNKNEYINDYASEINEFIYKYDMTYLIADCMTGKTTMALENVRELQLFDNEFIAMVNGDTIDLCVPYNSVADNKAKGNKRGIKRVKTADISEFKDDKRNVFIWNTIMPLYDRYFKSGVVKRMVLFFDESQKLVTDEYRWQTVFEMFKALPVMYKHFVFMTGTPAGELEFLKQYFPNYGVVIANKKIDYNRECNILKYKHFGLGDRINLIEEVISNGRLPLIYSNAMKSSWRDAIKRINKSRVEEGLRPYKVLEYSRPNADSEYVKETNRKNSIKDYDIVIGTKYLSVGIDFVKDDSRMRCAIIDYAGETDCTFHDIWQFTLRNRNQDTITKIIAYDNEDYYNKLYNYSWYVKLFDDMAMVHTHNIARKDVEMDEDIPEECVEANLRFIDEVFKIRKFGAFIHSQQSYFDDVKNVKLLGIYYLYRKVFSNMNVIKHMLKRRGVDIVEMDVEHQSEKGDFNIKKEIYKFFVDNWKEIGEISCSRGMYDKRSYLIDVNSDDVEYIEDGKIYSRNMHYMDWLIKKFACRDEWYEILKETEYMSDSTFSIYNKMRTIAKKITKKEIEKIKKYNGKMTERELNELVIRLVNKHYGEALGITEDDIRNAMLLRDVIDDYTKILSFSIENIEYIEEIKNTIDEEGTLKACHQMKIIMDQKANEQTKKKMSKAHKKKITIRWEDGTEEVFESRDDLADRLGVGKSMMSQILNGKKQWKGPKFEVLM